MPAPAIVYDGLRLFLGATARTPRGIDRVDIAYAQNLVDTWPGDVFCLLPTPWGVRLYDRAQALQGLTYLADSWRERADAGHDAGLDRVLRRLAGQDDGPPPPRRARLRSLKRSATGLAGMLRTGPIPGMPAARIAPHGSIYLNISQLPYGAPLVCPWLRRRSDIRPVYLMHDLIPIERPDLVAPIGTRLAKSMLGIVRRHAAGLIFTTDAARAEVLRRLDPAHLPAMLTVPLPIAPAFLQPDPEDADLRARNYFIVCSAIDPRKNHLMLLEVWRELVRRHGERAPKLAVIGSTAWAGKELMHALENCGTLRRHVIVGSGLSSPALRRLMAHARALLLPSRAEGFGLPVIEALTLGTPVVVSDLPALREAACGCGVFLDVDDQAAWTATIEQLAMDQQVLERLRLQTTGFQAMRAEGYFARVHHFLHELPRADLPAGSSHAADSLHEGANGAGELAGLA
jgi:glycosyltransferase involved in cell wall biosynthesis